jgi:class 3 adenylate cyclase
MHRLFRNALNDATGVAESVIVVMTDVRNFSRFSEGRDSVDVAMFIKRVYIRLIDDYFPFASFYKSTGDGLLLVVPIGGENIAEVSRKVVESCINCHSEFSSICSDDPMINFKVPEKIGIGIARGTVCRLVSGDKVIDYSGRLLNLTSRLTQLARPSGIVIDGKFGINLLSEEQRSNFEEDNVYLDGIAEYEPVKIYFTKEFTTIPKRNRQPIAAERWQNKTDVKPFRELLKLKRFRYSLGSEPIGSESIKVTVTHSMVIEGKVSRKYSSIRDFIGFEYKIEAGKPVVLVDFPALCEILQRYGVKKNMNVTISIDYVEK